MVSILPSEINSYRRVFHCASTRKQFGLRISKWALPRVPKPCGSLATMNSVSNSNSAWLCMKSRIRITAACPSEAELVADFADWEYLGIGDGAAKMRVAKQQASSRVL